MWSYCLDQISRLRENSDKAESGAPKSPPEPRKRRTPRPSTKRQKRRARRAWVGTGDLKSPGAEEGRSEEDLIGIASFL